MLLGTWLGKFWENRPEFGLHAADFWAETAYAVGIILGALARGQKRAKCLPAVISGQGPRTARKGLNSEADREGPEMAFFRAFLGPKRA